MRGAGNGNMLQVPRKGSCGGERVRSDAAHWVGVDDARAAPTHLGAARGG
jgi:hypothetical protein